MKTEVETILERLLSEQQITVHEAMVIMEACSCQQAVTYYPAQCPQTSRATCTYSADLQSQTQKLYD